MKLVYLIFFVLSFGVSLVATFFVASFARRRNIVDWPDEQRHFHRQPTPLLGGLGVYFGFFVVTLVFGIIGGYLLPGNIPLRLLIGIWAAGAILMVGGYLDDRFRLPPLYSLLFPVLAALTVIAVGVQAVSVHNPLSGNIIILSSSLSAVIVFVWTMVMTYTTKILDGMDGLVSGVTVIAALVLFGLSLAPQVMQPQTAMLAIALAGSFLGFLVLNFYPAKIFLGEGGSTFAGFMLAVLAIVSGGKMATTLLIMGIPLLDVIWVVLQRLRKGHSPFIGDRRHLHFQLQETGLSVPQSVIFLYALAAVFGIAALFLQSRGKLVALGVLVIVMLAVIASIILIYKRKGKRYE